jgi:hypothetical protein
MGFALSFFGRSLGRCGGRLLRLQQQPGRFELRRGWIPTQLLGQPLQELLLAHCRDWFKEQVNL